MNGEGAIEGEAAPERGQVKRSAIRCGRPPRELKGRVDERILDAAGKVFLERGFSGATVDEIAEVAGAGKPTIYARFPGKEALFTAVMERLVRRNTSLEAIPCAGASIEDRLEALAAEILRRVLIPETIGLSGSQWPKRDGSHFSRPASAAWPANATPRPSAGSWPNLRRATQRARRPRSLRIAFLRQRSGSSIWR